MNKLSTAFISSVLALAIGGGTYLMLAKDGRDCGSSVVSGNAAIGGPFILVDQTGQTVTEQEVFQKLSIVYFGYTYCPDICSIDTARNVAAVELAEENGLLVQPVFITFDPKRDTPEALADFAEAYHPGMIGLSGTQEQVDAAAKAYRVYYSRTSDAKEDYLFDHSAFSYLVGPDGFLEFFRRDQSPDEIAKIMACFASN